MDDLTKAILSFALGAIRPLALLWKVRKIWGLRRDLRRQRLVVYGPLAHLEPLASMRLRRWAVLRQLSEHLVIGTSLMAESI
jgi:hypothetical protein